MSEPPPGYLGADARIKQGPAPELVAAGYELELADAALLEPGLKLADLAHVLAHPAIPDDHRRAVLDALLELQIDEPDSRYGDIVNVRERELGDAAGWLNAGRPRREAGRIAFRIALRTRLLDLTDAIARFATALTEAAARERDALMPDYTYLQVAQPTTAGHWLLSFAYPAIRDAQRTLADFEATNRSPAGAGGVNGSRYAIDRERLAALLGFSGPIEHTRDAMWQTDGFAEAAFHAAQAATSASRFAEDVEIYGSDEFGLLSIGDELCRASALMPQKRNPYALVVIRGGARTLLGRATGVLASQQTPTRPDRQSAARVRRGRRRRRAGDTRDRARRQVRGDVDDRPRASRAQAPRERRDGDGRGRAAHARAGLPVGLRADRGRRTARPRPARRDCDAHRHGRRGAGADGRDAHGVPRAGGESA